MWQCPKCGRSFKNTDQHHFCGDIETIDQYICDQNPEIQPILQKIRETIRACAPEATEKIAWRMPTFWQRENLIHFAAHKNHVGLYPGDEAIALLANRLAGYKTTKGALQLPYDKPMPYDLIAEITSFRVTRAKERSNEK